jgi:phosphate starvation-inducible protein PhoH
MANKRSNGNKIIKNQIEEREYEELKVSVDKNLDITCKDEINKIINKEIKLIAKNESQKELIQSIKNNEITIVAGLPGSGKAQPLDALILCENGYKKMGDVKIGERIYSNDGQLYNILNIYSQGEKDIYKVSFSDGSSTECCKEHLWLTQTSRDRSGQKKINRKAYKSPKEGNLKTTEEIAKTLMYGINTNCIKKNHSIPITNAINFNKKDLDIHPYFLGVLLGDGCFRSTSISITSMDEELINKCNNILKLDNYYLFKMKISENAKYDYRVSNFNKINNYIHKVDKLNLYKLKSDKKFIPEIYKFSSIEDRIDLLNGIMDTDGTVRKDGTSYDISLSSLKLIEDIKFIVESLGGICNKIRTKQGKYKKNNEIIICKMSYRISFRLPNYINPFSLSRKKNLVKLKEKYFPVRYITNVEFIGKKEAQCILVDSPTHLYITNDFIVTHNTYVAVSYALNLLKKKESPYKRIYLVKSVTSLPGEEIGYLPGDQDSKITPYMFSYYINIEKVISESTLKSLLDKKYIKPLPLAYIRGASLDNCIIILDESQNVTLANSKTFLSRLGENSKMILLGDVNQVDLKNREESSLSVLLEMFKDVENIGVIEMDYNDTSVRNPLINVIENKFNEYNDAFSNTNNKKTFNKK